MTSPDVLPCYFRARTRRSVFNFIAYSWRPLFRKYRYVYSAAFFPFKDIKSVVLRFQLCTFRVDSLFNIIHPRDFSRLQAYLLPSRIEWRKDILTYPSSVGSSTLSLRGLHSPRLTRIRPRAFLIDPQSGVESSSLAPPSPVSFKSFSPDTHTKSKQLRANPLLSLGTPRSYPIQFHL